MVPRMTEPAQESSSSTRVPDQQLVEAQGSTVEVGSCVNIPSQQTSENEDTTQGINFINSIARVSSEHDIQSQESPCGIASSLHAPDGQASEDQESTQAFTCPPQGPQVPDALQGFTASASTDIPDRQVIAEDEPTQEFTASTIILVSDREATKDDEATQALTVSAITHVPDGPEIGHHGTARGFTASASTDLPDRQAFGDDATTQAFTASTIIQTSDQRAIGGGQSTQGFASSQHVPQREAIEDEETAEEHTAPNARHVSDRRAIEHEETTQSPTASKRNADTSGAVYDSAASPSTRSSGKHTAEAQDTAQEVPIPTSFAANLPDRQVVEADALTPPPPLTITTQASTALTHVTGTEPTEARREDDQPRRAASASHSGSIQAAAATSSPEPRTEARSTEIPNKDDERKATLPELGEEITRVSVSVPSARLTIAYNRAFIGDDQDLSKDVIRHPRTASGWDLISVVQDAKRADFIIKLSYYDRPVEEAAGRFIPFPLALQLVFQPASDNCVLFNHGGAKFYFEHLDAASTCSREPIDSMQCTVLRPGIWRIAMRSQKPHEDKYHSLIELLILPRKFGASVDVESAKRQKLSDTSLVRRRQETTILLHNLEDGQSARVWGVPGDTANYELQRIKHIASTPSARVFACRHSRVAGVLAVKVIDYDVKSVNRLSRRAAAHLTALVAAWKREASTLQMLNNNHIVSLKAFDGRFLALFMEQLPPSLDRGDTIKLESSVVRTIIHNISSALDYLEKQGIVHHDLKPHNIAHSPARGAVLLDFGQAAPATTSQGHGGTLAFLPPEFPRRGARGHAGDVWALGLTTLYLLGKITMPRLRLNVRIRDLYRYGSTSHFDEYMGAVALQRERLNLEDEIERLVFRMLDPKPEARATARSIVSALGKTLLTV